MSKLGAVVEAVENYNSFVEQVKRARTDEEFAQADARPLEQDQAEHPDGKSPTGLKLPRLALPEIDEAGEVTRYLLAMVCRANSRF